uniref:Uncharacterized protein n=1 Tax=Steinernema glaseri TaxID=37863 RepID=A0A1I7YZI5_9BILA
MRLCYKVVRRRFRNGPRNNADAKFIDLTHSWRKDVQEESKRRHNRTGRIQNRSCMYANQSNMIFKKS